MTTVAELESRIAVLEAFTHEQHQFSMLLFNLILRHDKALHSRTVEALRRILLAQEKLAAHAPMSPDLQLQLRSLRDNLLAPPSPEIDAIFAEPPLRPVD